MSDVLRREQIIFLRCPKQFGGQMDTVIMLWASLWKSC